MKRLKAAFSKVEGTHYGGVHLEVAKEMKDERGTADEALAHKKKAGRRGQEGASPQRPLEKQSLRERQGQKAQNHGGGF